MHTYLKAIGFSKKESQADIEELVKDVVIHAEASRTVMKLNGVRYVEYQKSFGEDIGIIVRGEEDEGAVFHIGNFFPYLKSSDPEGLYEEEIIINKKVDSDAYTGMCDDNRLGVTLIFYIQNIPDFIKSGDKEIVIPKKYIKLTSLADNGKVILPTQKRIYSHIASKISNAVKSQLMDEAKNGNMEALDFLAMNEEEKNAALSERIKKEDLFSIVETSFIPYGSESDLYTILANIISARQFLNPVTKELLWVLKLMCNDICFETIINADNLLGVPIPGMRFKGVIWMQGEVVQN